MGFTSKWHIKGHYHIKVLVNQQNFTCKFLVFTDQYHTLSIIPEYKLQYGGAKKIGGPAILTRTGSTLALDACLGNLSSGSARKPAATLPDSVLFGAPPPP